MTVTIDDLLAMVDGATEADVNAAVFDYSTRNPVLIRGEATRSATDDNVYDLPGDFGFIIRLDDKATLGDFYIAAGELVFKTKPEPDTVEFSYAAYHIANAQREYPLMGDDEAHIVALKLRAIVTGAADDGMSEYKIGDVAVKGGAAKRVETLESQYLEAVAAKIGTVGIRSQWA